MIWGAIRWNSEPKFVLEYIVKEAIEVQNTFDDEQIVRFAQEVPICPMNLQAFS